MEDKKLIFIADDDPIINKLVVAGLTSARFTVESFLSGEDCIAAIKREPDLVILDYVFPDTGTAKALNGMDVFRVLKDIRPYLPVIMLSGQDNGNMVLEFAKLGVKDYVFKDNHLVENLKAAVYDIFLE